MMNISKGILWNAFTIVALLAFYFIVPKGADVWVITPCLIIFYFLFFQSLRTPIQIGKIKSFIKIDVLFYIFAYLLYYLPYQKYVLGLTDLKSHYQFDYIECTNPSIIVSTIAMLAFALGYSKHKQPESIMPQHNTLPSIKYINKLATVLLTITVLLMIYYFRENSFFSVFYSSYEGSPAGSVFREICLFVMMLCSYIVFRLKYYKKTNAVFIIALFVSLLWALYLFLLGDRNSFFLIAIVLCGGYFTLIKSAKRKYLVLFLFSALLIYKIVEIARNNDNRSVDTYMESYQVMQEQSDGSSFDITTLGYRLTFDVIPARHDYFFGKFLTLSVASIVPFLNGILSDPNDPYGGSSEVIGYTLLGPYRTWGTGSNIVSDIYMDFGVPGVIILMFLIGLFSGFIRNKFILYPRSVKYMTLYFMTLALIAETPRYGVAFSLRYIVWAFLFFWLFTKLQRKNG